MKLRNKKTGEVTTNYDLRAFQGIDIDKGIDRICLQTENGNRYAYSSLAELNEEWEDYEEEKEVWYIDSFGDIIKSEIECWEKSASKKQAIGNYFETKEEAEKAVEKLKAWKRLKDKGFEFKEYFLGDKTMDFSIDLEEVQNYKELYRDLDLLFVGE